MQIGVLGTGMIAFDICPHLPEWGLPVAAVASTPRSVQKGRRLAELCGCDTVVTSLDELLALPEVDTVYVAVPNHLHHQSALAALRAGKNVICEKPLASNAREAEELSREARSRGLYLWEAITTLYLPNFQKVREWLPRIGRVRVVSCNYSQYSSRYDAFRAGEVLPAFDPAKSGGALMDLGVYCLSYIVGLFGEPQAVAYAANVERGIDTSGITTLDYGSFKAVSVAAKDCAAPVMNVIQGEDGTIVTNTPPNHVEPVTLHLNDGTEETFDANPHFRWESEFRSFAADVDAGEKGLAHCYQMLDLSLAIARTMTAARTHAGVRFPADQEA